MFCEPTDYLGRSGHSRSVSHSRDLSRVSPPLRTHTPPPNLQISECGGRGLDRGTERIAGCGGETCLIPMAAREVPFSFGGIRFYTCSPPPNAMSHGSFRPVFFRFGIWGYGALLSLLVAHSQTANVSPDLTIASVSDKWRAKSRTPPPAKQGCPSLILTWDVHVTMLLRYASDTSTVPGDRWPEEGEREREREGGKGIRKRCTPMGGSSPDALPPANRLSRRALSTRM